MNEIIDPYDLEVGKDYYIEKLSKDTKGRITKKGRAIGRRFKGIVRYKKNKHAYPEDGAVLGFSTFANAFKEDDPLVTFDSVTPLTSVKHTDPSKVTHFKSIHISPTSYGEYLGYRFYEVTKDDIYNNIVDLLSSKYLKRAPFLKEHNKRSIRKYLGTNPTPSRSSSSSRKSSDRSTRKSPGRSTRQSRRTTRQSRRSSSSSKSGRSSSSK
jgi:hypothetical protein